MARRPAPCQGETGLAFLEATPGEVAGSHGGSSRPGDARGAWAAERGLGQREEGVGRPLAPSDPQASGEGRRARGGAGWANGPRRGARAGAALAPVCPRWE